MAWVGYKKEKKGMMIRGRCLGEELEWEGVEVGMIKVSKYIYIWHFQRIITILFFKWVHIIFLGQNGLLNPDSVTWKL